MSSDSSVVTAVSARARASRINGARSRGPRTAAGKARSSRNALRHGLCAKKLAVLPDEDAAALAAFEAALVAELAPEGALQAVLAERVVSAAWRLARADRIETEVLAFRRGLDGDLGLALIRDGNGTRAVETVLRYRGAALAEFLRALRTLQALQAEARAGAGLPAASPVRRRARLRPKDFMRARSSHAPSPEPASAPHPAPARGHPAAAPAPRLATAATAKDNRANPPARPLAPQPVRPDAPNPDLTGTPPALNSPLATTERTQGTTPHQHLVRQRSAA